MLGWRDFRRMTTKDIIAQAVLVGIVVLIVLGAYTSAVTNLAEQNLTTGFSFLNRDTGWSYSFSLIERSIDDTYRRTLLIGFMNTLFVGFVAIFFSTILGFLIGTARDSRNLGLNVASSIYVQIFRNIPLILQVIFLYSILIHLPKPKQAIAIGEVIFISNRAIMIPALNIPLSIAALATVLSIALAVILSWRRVKLLRGLLFWLLGTIAIFALAVVFFTPEGMPAVSVPYLKGLKFRDGVTLTPELMGMLIGIILYSAAYIGEVVRGGLAEVPKGLTEAGESLGLKAFAVWWTIKVPMALRAIIPPLGNQWIFTMKATTVGVAIGFSDLFYIVSTSITQSGQTLELIAILAGGFLLVNFSMAQAVNLLNRRMALKGYG